MPISPQSYQNDFTVQPGQTKSFRFHFVVPAQLLPTACKHSVSGEHVHEVHQNLLPSMGEFLLPLDDLAPEMSKITYGITAKLIARPSEDASLKNMKAISVAHRKMHIIPAIAETPPLQISPKNPCWQPSTTKSLKRGMFKGKLGTINVSTTQPRALVIDPSKKQQPSTMATVIFKFYPQDARAKPPRLGAITSKLRAITYSSVRSMEIIPDESTRCKNHERFSGSYNNGVNLSSRWVNNVKWEWNVPAPAYARRDSGYSTASLETTSSAASTNSCASEDTLPRQQEEQKGWWQATVPIPVTLPKTKTWLPTFHSCLISRFYTFVLVTSIHTPSASVPSTQITLRVPIQIASKPRQGSEQEFVDSAPHGELVPAFSEEVFSARDVEDGDVMMRNEARRLADIEAEVNNQLSRATGELGIDGTRRSGSIEAPPGYERRVSVR